MDRLAEKFISDHRNPLKKVESPGRKCLVPKHTPAEGCEVDSSLDVLKTVLSVDRVDRRCARSKAIWLPDKNIAEVTKVVGPLLAHFGVQDKTGIYLQPEEALLLLETNRLEIFLNELPLSVQQAYSVILNDTNSPIEKYRAYKKLVLQGFIAIKTKCDYDAFSVLEKCKDAPQTAKLGLVSKLCNVSSPPTKKRHLDKCYDDDIERIFKKIKNGAPKLVEIESKCVPDYKLRLPNEPVESNLFVSSNETISCDVGWRERLVPGIIAVSNQNTLGCYKFNSVSLPDFSVL